MSTVVPIPVPVPSQGATPILIDPHTLASAPLVDMVAEDTVLQVDASAPDTFKRTPWSTIAAWLVNTLQTFRSALSGSNNRTIAEEFEDLPVSVKRFGARGDGATDDTNAINACIAAVGATGGGTIVFPPGVYLVRYQGTTLLGADREFAIECLYDNIHIRGCGQGVTIIRQMGGAIRGHVVKIGRRVNGTVKVKNVSVRALTIDGNKDNITSPDGSEDAKVGHCIDVSTGAERVVLEDLHLLNAGHYGIGMQRDEFKDCAIRRCVIEDCNGDAIDWKIDTNSSSRNNIVQQVTALRFGQHAELSPQAGIDVRNGVSVSDCYAAQYASDMAGVRVQIGSNDTYATVPTVRSVVKNVTCIADGIGTGTVGLQLSAPGVKVQGAHCANNNWNYRIRSSFCTLANISSLNGATGISVYGDATTVPSSCVVNGAVVRGATTRGVDLAHDGSNPPNYNLFNNAILQDNGTPANTAAGCHVSVQTGCTGTRFTGGMILMGGNNAFTDSGTDTQRVNVSGGVAPQKIGRRDDQHIVVSGDGTFNSITGISPGGSAKHLLIEADANSGDIWFRPLGATSRVRFGTYVAGATAVAGYIEIKDIGGTTRKIAVLT